MLTFLDVPMERPPQDVRVGQAIKHARERAGLTRNDVATRVNVTYQHIANVERGQKRCSPALLARLADTLNVPVTDLNPNPEDPR